MSDPNFNPGAHGFDRDNAYFLAWASELAYTKRSLTVRKAMRSHQFRKCRSLATDETQLFVAASDEAVLVAFRGTEGKLKDWMTDARITLTGGPLGLVHEGFALALGEVWAKLLEALSDYQTQGQGIWLTGHSLGGALATLAAAKLLERARPIRGLYTYGSPRCGNGAFAQNFDADLKSQTFRFVHNNDVVTRVPPRFPFGYRHVGRTYYLTVDGELQSDPSAWSRFVDRVNGRLDDFLNPGPDGISDHKIDSYIGHLDALRDGGGE